MDADGFPAKLGTPLGKVVVQGVVVAAAAGGWSIAPSVRPVVKGVFAAAGGGIGWLVRRQLVKTRRKAATGVLAKLLSSKGVGNVKLDEAWQLAKSYGVKESEFVGQLTTLYATYLSACLRSAQAKTSELSDLLTLQRSFNLGFDAVGDAIFDVCGRFYSEQRAYFEAEEEHEAKQKLDKLIFLADRALSEDPSEEGFRYERTRICRKFGFDDAEWNRRVERVGAPFYRELLATVSKDPGAVSSRDLSAVGDQLGLSEDTRTRMKLEELRRLVSASLEASGAKLTPSQVEKLRAVSGSLGVPEEQYRTVIEDAVAPAYSFAVNEAFSELEASETDNSANLLGKLALRQQELDLTTAGANRLEAEAAQKRASSLITGALTNLRSQNTKGAADALRSLTRFAERVSAFVRAAGKVAQDAEESSVMEVYFGGVAKSVTPAEATNLYRVFLMEKAEEKALDRLRQLTGVTEADAEKAYEEVAGPIYRSKLLEAVGAGTDSFPATVKASLKELEASLGLPAAVTERYRSDAYRARLTEKAGDGKIPSEADDDLLASLRAFLDLDDATVETIHVDICAAAYASSVRETMGSSGIILDEYREGLEKLQTRLRIPDSVAEEIYLGEARRKLKELGDKAVESMMEAMKKETEAPKEGEDAGKMNMDARVAITAAATQLVDFARAAKLTIEEGDQVIAKVNLRGITDPKSLKELYKQFLVECFQGQGEQSDKLFAQSPVLGKVLGLEESETNSIKTDLGSLIYRNYLNKALQERTPNDEDREFLASIQTALGMDAALCDRLLEDMKKLRVSTMVEQMFDGSNLSAESVATVRETSERFGLEIGVDLQLPQNRLTRMFRAEIEDAIASGDVPADDTGRLSELKEAYSLPEAVVTKELEQCIEKRCAGHLLQAGSALRRGQNDAVVEEIDMLIRFNSLMPFKVTSNAVLPNELEDLLMRYQASAMKDGPLDAEGEKRMSVLRTALGLEKATNETVSA